MTDVTVTVRAGLLKVSAAIGDITDDNLAAIFVKANIPAFNNKGKCYMLA